METVPLLGLLDQCTDKAYEQTKHVSLGDILVMYGYINFKYHSSDISAISDLKSCRAVRTSLEQKV